MIKVEFRGKHGSFQHKTLMSIGADICAQENDNALSLVEDPGWVIHPGQTVMIPTGLYVTEASPIPFPTIGQLIPFLDIRPRSSLNKKGILGLLGTVDADYRDEIKVMLHNTTPNNFRVNPGDRIGQLVAHYGLQIAEVLQEERKGGFGSTGKS